MTTWRLPLIGGLVVLVSAGSAAAQQANDPGPLPRPVQAEAQAAAADEDLLGEEALDALVAPIALYPDALLAQIFVAATYPIDIIKADRFIDANAALSDKERNTKAEAEDWDPSIAALVGGFPTVVQKMADEIDWTEQLGDAMLAQTDGVLDAVQRQRSRAVATGYLTSNEAQVVDTEGDAIAIEPADPNVVYVPTYDSSTVYTTPATAAPVVYDSGMSTSSILTTGAIAFGSALLINEIFDDNDDYDYWHGPNHVDWDNGDFYPRRGGNNDINGDVNIDVDRNRVRVGNGDRNAIDRTGAWDPSPAQKADARERIASRDPGSDRAAVSNARLKASDNGARGQLEAANQRRAASGKPAVASSALKPGEGGAARSSAAASRGASSIDRSQLSSGSKARASAAKPRTKSHPTNISRPKSTAAPPRASSSQKSSAFKKSQSGSKARASSSRGSSSAGRGGGGRGGGGGGGGRGGGGRGR